MNDSLSSSLAGGSLCEVLAEGGTIIKRYRGPIARGKEKLIREYEWFKAIDPKIALKYPTLFPKALKLLSNTEHGETELHLSRLPRPTLSKAILNREINGNDAAAALSGALDLLIKVVYTMRQGNTDPVKGYRSYHAERIALARKHLRRLPYMQPILDASELVVNGAVCPSLNQFLAWLDAKNTEVFVSSRLCAFHGNFHLDNILYDSQSKDLLDQQLSFIDPRGELLGFAHYDFSKVLITLEGYYDEIHYEQCRVVGKVRGNAYELNLEVSKDYDAVYSAGLEVLLSRLSAFANVEGVSPSTFVRMVLASECVHILSFAFYHAYNPGAIPNRIRAYIAVWALLCRRLFARLDAGSIALPNIRLPLK